MSHRVLAASLSFLASIAFSSSPALAQTPEGLSGAEWSSIRAAYEDGRHRVFERSDGTHQARTHGQQYATTFDGRRAVVASDEGDWSFGLELVRYGFDGHAVEVVEPQRTELAGSRIAYAWDDVVTEWYVNRDGGLEHGFTVKARPIGAENESDLRFDLHVLGNLVPSVDANGLGLSLFDGRGALAATYAGLVVTDARGVELAARMTTTADGLSILVDESGAAYPLTIDPIIQQAYVKASNTGPMDSFGSSVAIDGDTVVVGARSEDSGAAGVNGNQADNSIGESGAAYVFVRTGVTWTQQAYLKASNPGAGDEFGISVAIDGDTIVVGARDESSSATGVDGDQADDSTQFAGAVYVFTRDGTTWSQQAYLKASNTGGGDFFGASVAIDGDTIIVGAENEDGSAPGVDGDQADNGTASAGAVYVFTRSGSTWSQEAYLKSSNPGSGDWFGISVDISGDSIVVGASNEDSSATGVDGDQQSDTAVGSGAAYVFVRSASTWSQQAYLKASNTGAGDDFGTSVAIDGNTVVVGSIDEDSNATGVNGNEANNSASNSGAVYVFTRNNVAWAQQAYIKASNTGAGDDFGTSVDIEGDTVLVAAVAEDSGSTGVNGDQGQGGPDTGAVYVFTRTGSTWAQSAYIKASSSTTSDNFGNEVAISAGTVVVACRRDDSSATGINGQQFDSFPGDAGAVYIFDLDADWWIVSGCYANTAAYVVPTTPARIGSTVPIELVGAGVSEGLVATFYGAAGIDAFGCGFQLSLTEEQLLAFVPAPTFYTLSTMTGGFATIPLTLPDKAGLVGFEITLQSVSVDATIPLCEFSNGLSFVIRP
jgi:hypothetical protein